MVAMQSMSTRRVSPEGSLSRAHSPSFATSCACPPAERTICAPLPGLSATLCTVRVIQQSDARRAVGIVLDSRNGRGNAGLVALEIDGADLALVSPAAVPHGDVARVAASTCALLDLGQRLVRTVRGQIVVDDGRLETQRRGDRSVCLDCHISALAG